jgi:hypothetical protein
MNTEQAVYRRVMRRELYSSRAGAAITVAVALILLLAALGTVCVLLVVHAAVVSGVPAGLSDAARFGPELRAPVVVGGTAAGVLGIVLIVLGVRPGRRARRPIHDGVDRTVAVVDDRVIANALAARAVSAASVPPGQLKVTVGRRRAVARVVPTSGTTVDAQAVADALTFDAARYGLSRAPRVIVAEQGLVG